MSNFQLLSVGPSIHPPFEFQVAGTGFEGRASVIRRRCKLGSRVELRREPENTHDRNAIAVDLVWHTAGGREVTDQIGYVPAPLADEMTELIFTKALVIKKTTIYRLVPELDFPRVTVRVEGSLNDGVDQLALTGAAQWL